MKRLLNAAVLWALISDPRIELLPLNLLKKVTKTQSNDSNGEQLLETITKYMDIQGYKALFCLYEGRIIMYIPSVGKSKVDMRKILKHIETTTPSCDYKMGISDESDDIAKCFRIY